MMHSDTEDAAPDDRHPLAEIIGDIRMPIVVTDPRQENNPIIFANAAFEELTGYHVDEAVGRNCRFLQGPKTDAGAVARLGEAIGRGEPISIDLTNYRKDGTTFCNALHISPIRAENGEVRFFFATQLDVTDNVAALQAVNRQKAELVDLDEAQAGELQQALQLNMAFLQEVDRRVRNNLQTINSLVCLRAGAMGDDGFFKLLLQDLQQRLRAFASGQTGA